MIFESKLSHIEVPNVNVADYVLSECKRLSSADHRVFVDSATDEYVTVDQLIAYTKRFAVALRSKCGIRAGDVVATFANNSIYYPFVAYGIVAAGATCSPANASYTPHELAHQLSNSRCKVIIVGDGLRSTVEQALQLVDHKVGHILMLDESRIGCEDSIFEFMDSMNNTIEKEDDPFSSGQPEDFAVAPAYLCYSSGTTGKPKGVVLTHRNMIANAMQINQLKKLDVETTMCQEYETYLGLAPFCHAYGLSYVMHSSVSLGGCIVVMRRYSFDAFLKVVQEYKITFGYLVPPIVCALSKDPRVDSYDLSSMHTVLSGGAALSPTLIEMTEQRLPGVRVIQGYGMSEMSPAMTMLSTRHRNLKSIGILLPNSQAKVVDTQGNELGVCEPGELCFKGPNVMLKYLDNPTATRNIFDENGFLQTGDIGYIDEAGFFYITDRKKEIIKFKGFQVAPSELEGLLAEHPDIEDAAVMAVYDDNQATEIPKGYFVLKKQSDNRNAVDDNARGQAVVEWLHERVAKFKRLRGGFSIIENIPRSPAGKVIRNSLRNMDHISSQGPGVTTA
ncbi:acetyl-CoA synthetase-like protein [Coemansia reversa NRRL 1564]|uniref:Acetyl-CoA synthetase-like protein n=1 Tax=Coemansia reversa (strain ATCC 12441 / NRRL 1564) TaxID=763665 RepID=A0A2G5BF63_COERN|nr:acetyl-CoA synthetase-like protein [Coemansia reversa NRRL 1564]|eukprot:PIA17650.1 acetyl-CoA synthetase-like protein [Coemansia reversa NRRL 1564]